MDENTENVETPPLLDAAQMELRRRLAQWREQKRTPVSPRGRMAPLTSALTQRSANIGNIRSDANTTKQKQSFPKKSYSAPGSLGSTFAGSKRHQQLTTPTTTTTTTTSSKRPLVSPSDVQPGAKPGSTTLDAAPGTSLDAVHGLTHTSNSQRLRTSTSFEPLPAIPENLQSASHLKTPVNKLQVWEDESETDGDAEITDIETRISLLESKISVQTREIVDKDAIIANYETMVQKLSTQIQPASSQITHTETTTHYQENDMYALIAQVTLLKQRVVELEVQVRGKGEILESLHKSQAEGLVWKNQLEIVSVEKENISMELIEAYEVVGQVETMQEELEGLDQKLALSEETKVVLEIELFHRKNEIEEKTTLVEEITNALAVALAENKVFWDKCSRVEKLEQEVLRLTSRLEASVEAKSANTLQNMEIQTETDFDALIHESEKAVTEFKMMTFANDVMHQQMITNNTISTHRISDLETQIAGSNAMHQDLESQVLVMQQQLAQGLGKSISKIRELEGALLKEKEMRARLEKELERVIGLEDSASSVGEDGSQDDEDEENESDEDDEMESGN